MSRRNYPGKRLYRYREGDRRRGIGGSDAAAILGISPFATARDLYYDKLKIVPFDDSESNWVAKKMGHLLEDLVAMTLLLAVVLVLSLAACGAKGGDHMDGMDNEPKNAEEAAAMHKELTAQEAAILAENTALWEKVFMAADKGKIMMEDGKNYGDFLLETINAAKDQFSADELKLLQGEAEKIRDIGNKLAALEEKYPEIMQKSLDSDMNMPTDKDMDTMPDGGSKDNKTDGGNTGNTPDNGSTGNKTDNGSTGNKTDDSSLPKFPAFEGKDLDGNTVKSSDLFSGKAVTW